MTQMIGAQDAPSESGAAGEGASGNPDGPFGGNSTFMYGLPPVGKIGIAYVPRELLPTLPSEWHKPGFGTDKAPTNAPPTAQDQASQADKRLSGTWGAQQFWGPKPGQQTGSRTNDDYRDMFQPLPAYPPIGLVTGPPGFASGGTWSNPVPAPMPLPAYPPAGPWPMLPNPDSGEGGGGGDTGGGGDGGSGDIGGDTGGEPGGEGGGSGSEGDGGGTGGTGGGGEGNTGDGKVYPRGFVGPLPPGARYEGDPAPGSAQAESAPTGESDTTEAPPDGDPMQEAMDAQNSFWGRINDFLWGWSGRNVDSSDPDIAQSEAVAEFFPTIPGVGNLYHKADEIAGGAISDAVQNLTPAQYNALANVLIIVDMADNVISGISQGKGAVKAATELGLKSGTKAGLNVVGEVADTYVYHGFRDGKKVYVGVTKDIARRTREHGTRFDTLKPVSDNPVTRSNARAIEQAIIEDNPQFENIRNAISPKRPWYNQAVNWGRSWLESVGHYE